MASATVTVAGTVLAFQIDTGDEDCPLAARVNEKVFVTPDALAVSVAVSLLVTSPTFAVKLVFDFPDGIVTLEGTATLELFVDRLIGNPLPEAAPLNVTVQEVDAGPVTVLGLQDKPLSAVEVPPLAPLLVTDKFAPVADTGMALPSPLVAKPDTVMGITVLDVVLETVNVRVATVPAAKTLTFNPYTVQTMLPELLLHATVFPAPLGPEPRATLAPVMSAPE